MSTLTDSTLRAPAVPDTTLGPDPGQYRKPEIAVPDQASEYTPPLDGDLQAFARQEFEGNDVFQEQWTANADKRAAELKRRRKMKKMLLAVAGVAVVGVMALGAGTISPEPTPTPGPDTPTPGPDTPTPTPTSDCPTPSTIVGGDGSFIEYGFSTMPYERGTGETVLIAVYTDEWHRNGDFWGNHLIADYKCPEPEFESWTLPSLERAKSAIELEGNYEPVGYVLYYGPLEVVEDTYGTFYWDGGTEFALMLDDVITWEQVQFIPPDEHGVRYVNIHVMYAPKVATGSEDLEPAILIDDGLGNITPYIPASTPFESAGVTWLGSIPKPEMDCYWFAGWFDEEGNSIWYVWNEDIYDYSYNPDTDKQGITVHPVTIYAGWVPMEE